MRVRVSERELRIEPQNTGYDSERERLPSMNIYSS